MRDEAEVAHNLHLQIGMLTKNQLRCDMLLGLRLYEIKSTGYYKKAVGDGATTWVDYLAQSEVNIPVSRARKLIRVYKHFCLHLSYAPESLEGVPLYALDYIASRELVDVDGIDTLLADARVLTQKDFRERYHDEVVQTERTYSYLIMKKCNETSSMEKIHDVDSEMIKRAFNLD